MYVRTFLTLHPSIMGDDSLEKGGDLMDSVYSGENSMWDGGVISSDCDDPMIHLSEPYMLNCYYVE